MVNLRHIKNYFMKKNILYLALLFFAVVIAGFFAHLFIVNYKHLRSSGTLRYPPHLYRQMGRGLSTPDPSFVEEWMTFDYINRVFNLPSDYLKNELAIKSTKYPKITIYGEAKSQQISTDVFLKNLKNIVLKYESSIQQK